MGRGWIVGAAVVGIGAAVWFLLPAAPERVRGPALPGGTVAKGPAAAKPVETAVPEATAPVPATGDGGAEGCLLRSLTGATIPGTVTATMTAGAVVTAAAGANGAFRLRGLPRGEVVRIECASPGLLPRRMPRVAVPVEGILDLGYIFLGEGQRLDVLVVDGTGDPVAGAAVAVIHRNFRSYEEGLPPPEAPEAEAATDAAGRAAFPALPPGAWIVRAAAPGFATGSLSVDLVEGALREPYRIVLGPGGSLEGRVLFADGKAAAAAVVAAFPRDQVQSWEPPSTGVTDAEGRFRIDGLRPGNASVSVCAWPGVVESAPPVEIPAPGPVEIRLAPRGEIAGLVVDDATSAPLEGAQVSVEVSAGPPSDLSAAARAVTGADGAFRFLTLPALPVQSMYPSKEGYFEVGGTASAIAKERVLRLRRGAAVRGVVRETSGAPISLAWVRISTWRGREGIAYLPEVRSDEAGRYEIRGVRPGTALLEAGGRNRHLPGVPDDTWEALRAGEIPENCAVTVPESGVVEKDLVLVPDSRVEGRILHGDGSPAAGFVAVLGSAENPGSGIQGTASAADGSFVVEDLFPATNQVVAAMGPAGRAGVSAPFDLVESEVTRGVTVVVAASSSIAGRILRDDGKPAAGATLRLVPQVYDPENPWPWRYARNQGTVVPVAADGTFRADKLAPGPWTPVAAAPDCMERRGEALLLGVGETREGVEILLAPGFAIVGRVLDPAGAPVAGARVAVLQGKGSPEARRQSLILDGRRGDRNAEVLTDAGGSFRIPGLPAGTYEIRAAAEGFVAGNGNADAGSTDLVLRLGEGFPIQGRVVEQGTGTPAAGVTVSVIRSHQAFTDWENGEEGKALRVAGGPAPAVTGADGNFQLSGLAAGAWDLQLESEDGSFAPKTVRGVAAGTKNLVVEIPRGLAIAGRVEDAGGLPLDLRGLSVELVPAGSGPPGVSSREEEVGAGGAFSMTGLPAGRYRLTVGSRAWQDEKGVYAAKTIEVEAGTTDLVVPLSRGKPILGRVVLADGSVPTDQEFVVTLHPSRGGENPRENEWVSVDEKGAFRTDPLPDGIPFDLEAHEHETGTVGAARDLLPGATGVVLRLEKGKSIRGRVVDPEGNPLPGAVVFARPARTGEVRAQGEAGADGTFSLEGLAPGSYRLYARGEAGNFAPVEPEGLVAAGAEGAVVKTGAGFQFRARCVGPDGKPVEDAVAFVEAFLDGKWEGPEVHPVHDGLLVLRGLPRCRVRARLLRNEESFEMDGEGMAGPFEVPGEEAVLTLGK